VQFDDHRRVVARKEDLIQTFSNIITNFIDAMPRGGTIYISVEGATVSEAEGVRIVFRDEGTGIPEEHQKRIFEPFFTTKGSVGTGIGLWVVKQLIEQQLGGLPSPVIPILRTAAPLCPYSCRSWEHGPRGRKAV
jgi:signal transduction histidine kinase